MVRLAPLQGLHSSDAARLEAVRISTWHAPAVLACGRIQRVTLKRLSHLKCHVRFVNNRADSAIIDVAGQGTALGRRVTGTFRQFAKKQLVLGVPEMICARTPVFVHARDLVFLGEVHRCADEVHGEYTLEIAVRQAIARL